MANTILFVDNEQFVHKALKRTLRDRRRDWNMRFAADPVEALAIMREEPVEVLVTEMVFPGQSAVDFLYQVRDDQPQTVRIILSGYVDREVVLKSVDLAHQFLAKPCEDDVLRETVAKAFMMKDLLDQPPLKRLAARIESLPSLPALYTELVTALESENASFQKVGDIVGKDLAITAKLLKLVNSSFFGLSQRVTNPAKAVSLLGLDLVRTIVLASGTYDRFKHLKFKGFSLDGMWDHAMKTALLAKTIAELEGHDRQGVDTAFMAGVLHDIGKLVVAAYLPDSFRSILNEMAAHGGTMAAAETAIIGTTHAAVGAYLLGLWGLPDAIIQAAAYHHSPGAISSSQASVAGIVHVANAFANIGIVLADSTKVLDGLDYLFIEAVGWLGRMGAWQKACASRLAESESF